MRRYLIAVIALLLASAPTCPSYADSIRLKNGNTMKGIIKSEDEESVTLEIDIGTVKFSRKEIDSVQKTTPSQEAAQLRKQWDDDRVQRAEERQLQIKVEQDRSKGIEKVKVDATTGHMIASATINGKVPVQLIVDTGASLIVLSKQAGDKLIAAGVKAKAGPVKDVELTMGDGRKVKADYVTLDTVRIEGSSADNIDAAILTEEGTTPGYDGVLGMSFLKRFNFGFNQKEGKLTLEKLK